MIAAGRRSKTSRTASWISSVGDHAGAERLDEHADRLGLADRVGDLRLAPTGQTRGHDVLRHPAHRVRGRPVDLRRVLAGERTAAVASHPAVGVDDDLAAGQTGVAHRAADDEAAGRVDQQAIALRRACRRSASTGSMTCFLMSASSGVDETDLVGVLGGEHDGVDADGPVGLVVLDGDLGLAVGPQVGERAVVADGGEPLGEALGHRDRQRHQDVGVVAGVAEHQALVAGALLVHRVDRAGAGLVAGVDALGDVARLAADRDHDAA